MRYHEIDPACVQHTANPQRFDENGCGLGSTGALKTAQQLGMIHAAQGDKADASRAYQRKLQNADKKQNPADRARAKADAAEVYQRRMQKANTKQSGATASLIKR
jgi:hypothetical protein